MSNLSFKAFAQIKGFAIPVGALAVAKSMNIPSPPPAISLRQMIETLAPFAPYNPSYTPNWFYWWDQAALPIFDQPPDPVPQRVATSFQFTLWYWPSSSSKILVTDVTLPLSQVVLTNGGMAYNPGVLDGTYTFQIAAINSCGSASTPLQTAQMPAPSSSPSIKVTSAGIDTFQVTGTGFNTWNGQQVQINVDSGLSFSFSEPVPVKVDQNGGFVTIVSAVMVCGKFGSGALLRFSVSLPNTAGGAISNIVLGNGCH